MNKLKNKFEKKLNAQLKRSKLSFSYESERIPYILYGHYIPDFILETTRGKLYIEAKGYLRPEHKRKMIAVKKQWPQKDIRIVFYSPNKQNEKWAIRNGFTYAFGSIPREWLQ